MKKVWVVILVFVCLLGCTSTNSSNKTQPQDDQPKVEKPKDESSKNETSTEEKDEEIDDDKNEDEEKEDSFNYDVDYDESDYQIGNATFDTNIQNLSIDWVGGLVSIEYYDGDQVKIKELRGTSVEDEDAMRYNLDKETLSIKYCKKGKHNCTKLNKDLYVYLPKDQNLYSIELNVVSANTNIHMNEIGKIDIDSVRGNVNIHTNVLDTLNFDMVSGNIDVYADRILHNVNGDIVSGNMNFDVSKDEGFTLTFDSMDGKIDTKLDLSEDDQTYQYLDGIHMMNLESITGNVSLKTH